MGPPTNKVRGKKKKQGSRESILRRAGHVREPGTGGGRPRGTVGTSALDTETSPKVPVWGSPNPHSAWGLFSSFLIGAAVGRKRIGAARVVASGWGDTGASDHTTLSRSSFNSQPSPPQLAIRRQRPTGRKENETIGGQVFARLSGHADGALMSVCCVFLFRAKMGGSDRRLS